uniref:GK21458 n=1 Tax=Drosophila willistoni TaxID=7260 RepID=B4MQ99_DROWI
MTISPAVMPMNQNGRKRRDNDDFSVKLSTIRIWMHEKEIGKLTRILWAGQGHRLCQQASNNGRVKRFLAAVPHVMNAIKDLHQAVIDNNLETLQVQLEPPVPAALVTCKDGNGLNVIHKAAGLGHTKILEYLIGIWPEGAHEIDITGKTPLHWAASAKNNMRCYTLLTQAGCDEEALDYKMKTPSYYRHKPHEIERAFLVYVPEAPRVSPDSVTDWEALNDGENGVGGGGGGGDHTISKIVSTQQNGRKSLDDSLENTSELDTIEGLSANDELEDDDLSKVEENGQENGNGNDNGDAMKRRPETPATFDHNGQESEESEDVENVARDVSQATEENGNEKEEVEAADQKQQDEEQVEMQQEEEQSKQEEEQEEEKQNDEQVLNEKTDDIEEEAKDDQENDETELDERQTNGDDDKVNDEVAVPAENEDDNALAEPPAEPIKDDDDDDDDEVHIGVL